MKKLLLLVFKLLATATFLPAANTWTGGGSDGFWNNGGNWLEGSRPGFGGTATFTGTAGTTPQPDLNGASQTGLSLDFQTAGWTINDSVGGSTIRVDMSQSINSQGVGENRIMGNISSSGSGSGFLTVGTGNVLRFSGSYNRGSDILGVGLIVWDGTPATGSTFGNTVFDTGASALFNTTYGRGITATSGTMGGTGTVLGYQYGTSTIGDTAVLAPGGDGTYGDEIGTLTFQSNSATIRHNLVLETGASLDVQFDDVGNADKLMFDSYGTGRVSIQSGVTLNLSAAGAIQDGSYTIIENLATDMTNIFGTFDTLNFNGSSIDPSNFTVDYNGDSVVVNVTGVIPEPSPLVMLGLGLLGWGFRFRRR